ncbi:MAG TPA: hypothetical protein VF576_04290 [Rubricoccaceae bacterium]|jgi:hypothetical protein
MADPAPLPPEAEALPACRVHGHDRYHHAVRADLRMGPGGWFAILNGASGATPREIAFSCSLCGETFETTRDPAVLRQFRRFPYVDRSAGAPNGGPAPTPPR